ncbi:hypothetical protein DERP_013107 [Dermatophagoides pteronyssinus]|uniref:Uncharacterized protein n=1 Tax=Dermatophagoides pteronyssinus TaxID=6956 RepID=A0ABQ8J5K1_DERPT|nr:hypothetical protein DERP_013107 [Dermatophagoides pteronyssinus]
MPAIWNIYSIFFIKSSLSINNFDDGCCCCCCSENHVLYDNDDDGLFDNDDNNRLFIGKNRYVVEDSLLRFFPGDACDSQIRRAFDAEIKSRKSQLFDRPALIKHERFLLKYRLYRLLEDGRPSIFIEKKTYFELRIDDDDRCGWSSISDEDDDDEEIEAEIVPIKLAIIIMLANQMNNQLRKIPRFELPKNKT